MARKPNYKFERSERERIKAIRSAAKIEARRVARERSLPSTDGGSDPEATR